MSDKGRARKIGRRMAGQARAEARLGREALSPEEATRRTEDDRVLQAAFGLPDTAEQREGVFQRLIAEIVEEETEARQNSVVGLQGDELGRKILESLLRLEKLMERLVEGQKTNGERRAHPSFIE